MASNSYIWTKHALKRLSDRKIPQSLIDIALSHPDKTTAKDDNLIELQKRIEGKTVAAIVKIKDNGEKIVVSCWVNPPYPGTKDAKKRARYLQIQAASPLKKLWLTALDQLGF